MRGMSDDTHDDARQVQIAAWRRMGPSRRIELAIEMSEAALRTAVAGEMRRHPELTEQRATHAVRRRMWGADLADRAFGVDDR